MPENIGMPIRFCDMPDGEGVHHPRREAETGRQHRDAQPYQRVPPEGVTEQHHDGDEGDELLEHPPPTSPGT